MIKWIGILVLIIQPILIMAYSNNEESFREFYDDYNKARVKNDTVFLASMYPENYKLIDALPEYFIPFVAEPLHVFLKDNKSPFSLHEGEVYSVKYLSEETIQAEIFYPQLGEKHLSIETYTYEDGFWRVYSSQQIADFMDAYGNAKSRYFFILTASLSTADSTQLEIDINGPALYHIGRGFNEKIVISKPGSSHNLSRELFFISEEPEETLKIQLKCNKSGEFSFNYKLYKLDKDIGEFNFFEIDSVGTLVATMSELEERYAIPYNDFLDMYEIGMKEGDVNDIEITVRMQAN